MSNRCVTTSYTLFKSITALLIENEVVYNKYLFVYEGTRVVTGNDKRPLKISFDFFFHFLCVKISKIIEFFGQQR